MNITELWSRLTPDSLTAAAFMGEGVVLGDASGLLLQLGPGGTIETEQSFPPPILDVSTSRDGKVIAVLCGDGELVYLSEGKILWRKTLADHPSMLRCGREGDYVLAVSRRGRGVFMNRYGRIMTEVDLPGGADSVALVPQNGRVVAANRDGRIQCFTSWGKPLWSTELNLATNPIASNDAGDLILIPTMAYGVEAMRVSGESVGAYEVGEPIKHASCSADGQTLLFSTLKDRLVLLDQDARVLCTTAFASQISALELSADGKRVLISTGCGYAHLLAITAVGESPLLEMDDSSPGCSNPRPLFTRQVFSPFSMLMQARAAFSPDSATLVIAGDRQRVQVFDLSGEELARRRFGGSLLKLMVLPDGTVRVFATKSVFTFSPRTQGTRMEWSETVEIQRVSPIGPQRAVILTEDAEVVAFDTPGSPPERLFYLDSPEVAEFSATKRSIASVMRNHEVLVLRYSGELAGVSGPWPVRPRILAHGEPGLLLGVQKLIVFVDHEGEELWRAHLPSPAREGHVLPGTFMVQDESGTVHAVTTGGAVHPVFRAGNARVIPFPDGGEGPGFIVVEGGMLTAVHPNGLHRWRYRVKDDVAHLAPSPDGRWLAVMAGNDLCIIPLVKPTTAPAENAERTSYLEFADG